MVLESRIITKQDLEKYRNEVRENKVQMIWEDILQRLPGNLRVEAVEKGFVLRDLGAAMELRNFIIEVPNASKDLELAVLDASPYVVCE